MYYLTLFLKGVAMGAANVIPGVSGGTIAFITGIYERLINALKSYDLEALRLLLKGKFKEFAEKTDFSFVVAIFLGVAVSILSLAKVLELAITSYEIWTFSFFFGLILASIIGVSRQVNNYSIAVGLFFLLGAAIAVAIAFLPPATANGSFFYVFLCGLVAVCSMILPGISGSYLLLLMGNYALVLRAISSFDFEILVPLFIGVVVGLILFSRLLSFLFAHYKNNTIALLAGFVAGSLLIIWPWKHTLYETFDGKEKAVGYNWYLPIIDASFFIAVALIALGFFMVWIVDKRGAKNS